MPSFTDRTTADVVGFTITTDVVGGTIENPCAVVAGIGSAVVVWRSSTLCITVVGVGIIIITDDVGGTIAKLCADVDGTG